MTQHQRYTYSRGSEVIDYIIGYLKHIRDVLDELREDDQAQRVAMLLTTMETEHRNLLGSFERIRSDAPEQALETYSQYIVELPRDVGRPEEPVTTVGLLRWLQGLNGHLYQTLKDLGEKEDAEEAAEMFSGMALKVESHERTLSKEQQRFEDL